MQVLRFSTQPIFSGPLDFFLFLPYSSLRAFAETILSAWRRPFILPLIFRLKVKVLLIRENFPNSRHPVSPEISSFCSTSYDQKLFHPLICLCFMFPDRALLLPPPFPHILQNNSFLSHLYSCESQGLGTISVT